VVSRIRGAPPRGATVSRTARRREIAAEAVSWMLKRFRRRGMRRSLRARPLSYGSVRVEPAGVEPASLPLKVESSRAFAESHLTESNRVCARYEGAIPPREDGNHADHESGGVAKAPGPRASGAYLRRTGGAASAGVLGLQSVTLRMVSTKVALPPLTKREMTSKTASLKPPTFNTSARSATCVCA
jgi:hypothetical protein